MQKVASEESLYRKRKNKTSYLLYCSFVLLFNFLCTACFNSHTRTGDALNRPLCSNPSIQAPCTIQTLKQIKFVLNHPIHRIRARFRNIRWQRRPQEYAIIGSELETLVKVNAADNSAEAQGSQLFRSKGEANVQSFVHLLRLGQAKVGPVEAKKAKRRIIRA